MLGPVPPMRTAVWFRLSSPREAPLVTVKVGVGVAEATVGAGVDGVGTEFMVAVWANAPTAETAAAMINAETILVFMGW